MKALTDLSELLGKRSHQHSAIRLLPYLPHAGTPFLELHVFCKISGVTDFENRRETFTWQWSKRYDKDVLYDRAKSNGLQ